MRTVVDRLLAALAGRRVELDDHSVLVVDEAGMVGTRKLAPLLTHVEHAGAKVVLVGDDRQFSPVDAGGGFRGLRLRLGASELTINRRQVQAWEQQAIDLVREQRVEEPIAAYREHDRIRVYESRDQLGERRAAIDVTCGPSRPDGCPSRSVRTASPSSSRKCGR